MTLAKGSLAIVCDVDGSERGGELAISSSYVGAAAMLFRQR
jgi:hypothetical protein